MPAMTDWSASTLFRVPCCARSSAPSSGAPSDGIERVDAEARDPWHVHRVADDVDSEALVLAELGDLEARAVRRATP